MTIEMLISICLGVGLAASTGFRVFVPLFGVSLAAYFGIIPLNEDWMWVGSLSALVILGVASVIEALGYLVPVVDNLLDTIAVPLAGVAGTLVMASTLTDMSPAMTWALAIVAGGGAAATIKTTSAATRAVSTVTTAGVANPAFGAAETTAAIGLSALSIFVPVLGFIAVLIAFFGLIWLGMRIKKKMAQ
ncbi:DUF4126 domain-containing protein [Moraxella sp. FZLJ2107]|uniref:DUF4126 domain-containing protein n=1 Tax=unclassified Moraxella TaxID=2685852 RepID=UPI0020C8E118|nr:MULTISPECIES: DUF4126 domain-containing protein [unclassified Moraxella]UTO05816.1 DUF4126 domain-containing protein [Moraxella sp. FZLJ2107]UTO22552.1 DUF4126 domain-containing protein [Moraxella sp. FZLJ2109]